MKKHLLRVLVLISGTIGSTTGFPSTKALLRENYTKASKQLDELSGSLEYLGQVVNRGAITATGKKQEIRLWVLQQLGLIRDLQAVYASESEQSLIALLQTINAFAHFVCETIEQNLEDLRSFEQPIMHDQSPSSSLSPQQQQKAYNLIGTLLDSNNKLFLDIHHKISTLGLTTTNKVARWLDKINNRYGITDTLEQLPRLFGLSAAIMYFTPYKYFFSNVLPGLQTKEPLPGFNWLKRKIGTSKFLDPEGHKAISWYGREDEMPEDIKNPPKKARPNSTLADLLNSKEKKLVFGIIAGAAYLLFNDPLKEHIDHLKASLRPEWAQLKGFTITPTVGHYKHPDITLDDPRLIGLDSQIAQMRNIVQYVIEPETFDRSASGLEKGILLTGPSRCGKTLLANALCGTLNQEMHKKGMDKKFAFKAIKWSEIKWSSDGIKSILEDAKRNAPCVLFIDELHNLPLQVKEGGEVLSQFLTMTESLQSTGVGDAVIVLAATNRPYALDDALLKPGRFGHQIHFEKPTFELRKEFFAVMCQYNAISTENFDLDQLGRLTEGCSHGDLDMIVKSARFIARHEKRALRQQDFLGTIYEQIYRIRFDEKPPLTPHAHQLIATHHAGHALLAILHEHELQERVEFVTTRGQWAKIEEKRYMVDDVHQAHDQSKITYGHLFTSHTSEAVTISVSPLVKAKMLLAGAIAEEVLLGSSTRSYHPEDTREALKVLEAHIFNGLTEEDFTKQELVQPKQEAKRLLRACQAEVRTLLERNKRTLVRLSKALQQRLLLTYTDIKEILEISEK